MLEWTGERFIPWMDGAQIHYEHIHRYAFASQFVKGKKVLDLACGEGYGSYALSKNANHVVGVDIDENAVQHARNKYTTQNLEFIQGSILEIPIQGNEKFDVIVCFEGIEHVEEHGMLLSEVKRLLNKDGVFIVSSPNKKTYSDDLDFNNQFHKKELYFNDFRELLDNYFSSCIFFGQKVYSSSNIWSLPPYQYSDYKEFIIEKQDKEFYFSDIERKNPLYFIAIASGKKLDHQIYNIGSHLVDVSNILIGDFEKQVGMLTSTVGDRDKNITELNNALQARDGEIIELNNALQSRDGEITELNSALQARDGEIIELNNALQSRDGEITELNSALQARDGEITELNNALQSRDGEITELNSALQARDGEITELNNALQSRDGEIIELTSALQSMQQSIVWRSLMKYSKLIDVLLPHGTYRRRYYDGWLLWMRGVANKNKDFKKGNESIKNFENAQKLLEHNDTLHKEKIIISQYSHDKIKSMDIICFPIINWDFRCQRSQHLLTRFAKNGYRVFYLTVDLTPLGQAYSVREIEKNILELKLSISSNYNVYANNLSKKQIESLQDSLNKVKIDFNIDKALSFVEFPNWEPLVSKLKETNDWDVLYDCMDEHTSFSNINSSVSSREVKLFNGSDVVAVTSKHLYEKAKNYRKDVIFIPNAGEFEHFYNLPENTLLADIKKPIIGYFGAIAEWFDNELIEYLATKRKNWNFVFIGHTFGSSIKKLETYPNVHFFGEKNYAQLPKYLYWFDVCMIPFKLTPLIKATHPVKFYEYLSPGKPVVSVKLPELLPYSDLCYIAEDKEEFLDKIEIALKENDPIIKNKRIEFAKNNTWEDRYRVLISNVEQLSKREDSK